MTVSAYQAILIAGFGSRLHPLCNTKTAPKALLPVANQATLGKCVAWIEAGGIKDIIIITASESVQIITDYLNSLYRPSADVESSIKVMGMEGYWGTAEAVYHARDRIKNDFVVLTCDLITNVPLGPILDDHRIKHPAVTCFLSTAPKLEAIKPGDHDWRTFIATDHKQERILYHTNEEDIGDFLSIRMSLLSQFPNINLRTDIQDNHVYICSRWILDYIVQKVTLASEGPDLALDMRLDIIATLIKSQYLGGLAESEGVEQMAYKHALKALSSTSFLSEYRDYDNSTEPTTCNRNMNPNLTNSVAISAAFASYNAGSISSSPSKMIEKSGTPDTIGASSLNLNRLEINTPKLNLIEEGRSPVICRAYFPPTTVVDSTGVQVTPYSYKVSTLLMYGEINRLLAKHTPETLRIAESAEVHRQSGIGDSLIGESSKVDERCSIKRTVVGAHCIIGKNVKLVKCVLMDYVRIEDKAQLEGCVLSPSAVIGEKCKLTDCEVAAGVKIDKDTIAKGEKFTDE